MPDPDHGEWWVKILKPILKSSGSQYKEDETKVYVIPFFFFNISWLRCSGSSTESYNNEIWDGWKKQYYVYSNKTVLLY